MKKSASLIPVFVGLGLGAAGAWTLRHYTAAPPRDAAGTSAPATTFQTERLTTVEADDALAAYLALPPLFDAAPATELNARLTRLRALLTLLPDTHIERLLAALAMHPGDAESKLRGTTFDVWCERDAAAAARWALTLVSGEAVDHETRAKFLTRAADIWAGAAFDPAYAWASTLTDEKLRHDLLAQILSRLVATDSRRALTLVAEQGPAFVATSRSRLFSTWAKDDPAAALRAIAPEFNSKAFTDWTVTQAIIDWVAREPDAALDWVAARPAEITPFQLPVLSYITWHLGKEPRTARATADYISSHPNLPGQADLLVKLSQAWAGKDPHAMLAWVDTLPVADQRNDLVNACLLEFEADGVFAAVNRLPESSEREKRIGDFIANWTETDPAAALAWIDAHPSRELKTAKPRIQTALIARLVRTDVPAALARWENLPTPAERQAAIIPLALAWAPSDPAASASWLITRLQAGDIPASLRSDVADAYANIAILLGRTDPEALLRLADSATDPDLKNRAYNALAHDDLRAREIAALPPFFPHALRADLLATIPDPKLQEKPLALLLAKWLERDYVTARAWIDAHHTLSPTVATDLIAKAAPIPASTP